MSNMTNRYDFVYLFDVKDGNPNGDPDQDNLPRVDLEDQKGLVTDVCIKRKVRNYVMFKYAVGKKEGDKEVPAAPYDIFIREREKFLNDIIDEGVKEAKTAGKDKKSTSLCEKYYDIRTFGAVLSTGDSGGAGVVRGPVQFTFARSIDPIFQMEHRITRCAVTTEKEAKSQKDKGREFASTMGHKFTVPYGLYRMHGFVSAVDAGKSGFSQEDLDLLWEALKNAFEHDRSAARGEMAARKLIVFKHDSHLGNARSSELFEKVDVKLKENLSLPRGFEDYQVNIDKNMPAGVTLHEML